MAVEEFWYTNVCMQVYGDLHKSCRRYVVGESEKVEPSTSCAPNGNVQIGNALTGLGTRILRIIGVNL